MRFLETLYAGLSFAIIHGKQASVVEIFFARRTFMSIGAHLLAFTTIVGSPYTGPG